MLAKVKQMDRIYLDNTFLDKSCGAKDLLLVAEAVDEVEKLINQYDDPSTVIIVAVDQVGKENFLCALAMRYRCKIYLPPARWETLHLLELEPKQLVCFTNDITLTRIRMCSRNDMTLKNIIEQNQNFPTHTTIGIRPSGYAITDATDKFSSSSSSSSSSASASASRSHIHRVKYSSHSSRNELMEFLHYLQPLAITATSVTTASAIAEIREAMVDIYGDEKNIPIYDSHLQVPLLVLPKSRKRIRVAPRERKKRPKLCIVPKK